MEHHTKTITSFSKLINFVFDVAFTQWHHHQRNKRNAEAQHRRQSPLFHSLEALGIVFQSSFQSVLFSAHLKSKTSLINIIKSGSSRALFIQCICPFFVCFKKDAKKECTVELHAPFVNFSLSAFIHFHSNSWHLQKRFIFSMLCVK